MSKISSKQRYVQLKEWLETYKSSPKSNKKITNKSRLNYYKTKGVK